MSNPGLICGTVWQGGSPIESWVALKGIAGWRAAQDYRSKSGGRPPSVFTNKNGEFAIYFYWDLINIKSSNPVFSLIATQRHGTHQSIGKAQGKMSSRVNLAALSSNLMTAHLTQSTLAPVKAASFLKKAVGIASGLRRSAGAQPTATMWGLVGAIDISLP